ncbi:MAG: FtsL-like putative cell division protein [Bacteroidia bacterium]
MNRLKSKKGNEKQEKSNAPRKKNAMTGALHRLVDGTLLEGVVTQANLPYGLFLTLIIGLYIANTYNAEKTTRRTSAIEKELKDLSSEYISMKSDLMFLSNQSQVAQRVAALNLYEAKTPPHKLFIQSADSTGSN